MFAAVPVTHRVTKGALIVAASPLTAAFRHNGRTIRRPAAAAQRSRVRARAAALPRARYSRGCWRDALALGKLDLKHDHVALAKRHLGAGEVELPHPHEARLEIDQQEPRDGLELFRRDLRLVARFSFLGVH